MNAQNGTTVVSKSKEELSNYFGNMILSYRTKAGKSQSELADLMNTSRNTVINWEKGKNLPDMAAARQLAVYLNIPLYEFFDISASTIPSSDERRLIHQYRDLSVVGKKVAYEMIKTMAKEEQEARDRHIKEKYIILPLQSTPAAAGTGCPDSEEPPEPFFVKRNRISERADTIIRVSGRSMEPVYFDGDYVYIKFADGADDEEDVVCVYHEGFIIKRYRDRRLFSLNKAYDFGDKHDEDNIHIVGRVLGVLSSNDEPDNSDKDYLDELFSKELREFDKENGVYY